MNTELEDGISAIYTGGKTMQEIILYNVHSDYNGTYFNAKDKKTGKTITKFGRPVLWMAEYAITNGKIIIPNYKPKTISEPQIKMDPLKEQRNNLRNFFINNVLYENQPFYFDDEQLNAIISTQNSLTTARAGSGKTRTIIGKLIYLFEKENLKDNNVLAFCFNHDASMEISDRLNNKCEINHELKYKDFDVAKTFHSFSKQSIDIGNKILTDRTKLLKLIINDLRTSNKDFARNMYQFFRAATLRIDRKNFVDTESYYKYVRNCEYITLNGEKVKSKIEKYIADYLFEHGIEYIYEKSYYPYKISLEKARFSKSEIERCIKFLDQFKETVPDFYLPKYNIVWEHWAVDGTETQSEKDEFTKTICEYQDYIDKKDWKQKFWSNAWREKLANINKYNTAIKEIKLLIETTHKGLSDHSRELIEDKIQHVLNNHNVFANKLPDNILIDKVWSKSIDGFTILIDQFINKLQQNYFDNIDLFVEKAKDITDERTKMYYRLGFIVYQKYIEILSKTDNTGDYTPYNDYAYDFNQIIFECCKAIKDKKLDDKIKNLKWILIDEYQDFSRLFDYLINSIIERNNNIKLFCVGDDWQAINRFAGSDLQYYNTFAIRYSNTNLLSIKNNYRSEKHIVWFANQFMSKCGFTGPKPNGIVINKGESKEIDVQDTYIGKFDDVNNIYLKYLTDEEPHKIEKAKYLKMCADIIKKHQNEKIMILNRSNQILGKELEEFNLTLRKICSEFVSIDEYNKCVFMKTVHKAKGEEADVVIILNVNESVFPVFNSNNDLFEIFGHTTLDTIEDEERLYYVALTRAKHNLYILYENSKKSAFIMDS